MSTNDADRRQHRRKTKTRADKLLPLQPGTRLGPYEITAQIGEGGMGEVYRATDTKLKRDVAVKVLPASLAADPEKLARFQRGHSGSACKLRKELIMRGQYLFIGGIVVGLSLLPLAVFGHHAAQVTYHMDQVIEVEGEIASLVWRNPHLRFTMNVPDAEGGTTLWNVESIPVTRLTRVGVSSDLVDVGQTVRVAGFPSRRSTTDVYAINLLLADGREVLLDTTVARWTDDTVGTGQDLTPGSRSSDSSLGLFRVWSTDGVPLALGTVARNNSFTLTEEARAAEAAWDPLSLDNPFRGCSPKGMPNIMAQPNPMEFVDQGDEILLRMEEYDTVRVIAMRPAPADEPFPPSILGRSVGRWDGAVLVVETDRINWSYFNQQGLRQSEAIELVERFSPSEDGARLDYELTVTDPALFTEPAVITKSWVWVPGDEVLPFDCTE